MFGEILGRRAELLGIRLVLIRIRVPCNRARQRVAGDDAASPFDIVVEGETPGDDPAAAHETTSAWEIAGATWWIESLWNAAFNDEKKHDVSRRIEQGPPRATP